MMKRASTVVPPGLPALWFAPGAKTGAARVAPAAKAVSVRLAVE
jgi:hypothetical protein